MSYYNDYWQLSGYGWNRYDGYKFIGEELCF